MSPAMLVRVTYEPADAAMGAAVAEALAGALARLLGPARVAHARTLGMTPAVATARLERLQRDFDCVVAETALDDAAAFRMRRADHVVAVARALPRPRLRARLLVEAGRSATRLVAHADAPLRCGQAAALAGAAGVVDAYGLCWDDRAAIRGARVDALAPLARALSGMRVGLALGSGSSRGFAHIGALEALTEMGVPVDIITGSSAGAGIGSVWALGFAPDTIHRRFAELARHATRPTLSLRSLFCGDTLRRHLEAAADGHGFEDALVPFGAVAADLHAGTPVLLTAGPLPRAVLASCSVPGLYPPVEIGGRRLVDGGLLAPVPCEQARALGADRVIAVDLEPTVTGSPRRSTLASTLLACIDAMRTHLGQVACAGADLVLRPIDTAAQRAGIRDFARAGGLRELGRAAALAARPEIERALPWLATRTAEPMLVLAS